MRLRITLVPQRNDEPLAVSKSGSVLTLNGEAFDFSPLPEGATIPAGEVPCKWFVGPVEMIGGELHLKLILPHGASPSEAVANPAAIIAEEDGPIELPHDPEPQPEQEEDEPDVVES